MLFSWICPCNILGTEGRRDGGQELRGQGLRTEVKGRGPRAEEHKHPTNQKLDMSMTQIFKTKCILNFRKYRSRKIV